MGSGGTGSGNGGKMGSVITDGEEMSPSGAISETRIVRTMV